MAFMTTWLGYILVLSAVYCVLPKSKAKKIDHEKDK